MDEKESIQRIQKLISEVIELSNQESYAMHKICPEGYEREVVLSYLLLQRMLKEKVDDMKSVVETDIVIKIQNTVDNMELEKGGILIKGKIGDLKKEE